MILYGLKLEFVVKLNEQNLIKLKKDHNMCFSANASFSVSAVLLVGSVIAIRKVQRRSQIPSAAIPFIFSIQQFIEGLLWLSLIHPAYAFLTFAQVVWPFWVPFSVFLLEKDTNRKKILSVLLALAIMEALYLAYCLLVYHVHSTISNHHIHYVLDFPAYFVGIGGIIYFMATVIPTLLSSVKKMSVVGAFLLGTFLVSKVFLRAPYFRMVLLCCCHWCYGTFSDGFISAGCESTTSIIQFALF